MIKSEKKLKRRINKTNMGKFSKEQWVGILLILAALLIWTPASIIPYSSTIAALVVIIIGIWKIFF